MRIGQLAKQSGVPSSTIRFYEQKGLLPSAQRLASGYRNYDETTLDRLQLIKFSQSLGFALDDLPILVNQQGGWDHQAILERLLQKQQEVDALLAKLKSKKQTLTTLVTQLQQHWLTGNCMEQDTLAAIIGGSEL